MIETFAPLAVMGAILITALSMLPNAWSGKGLSGLERRMRVFWFWGEGSLQGFRRANTIAIVGGVGLWVAWFAVELLKVIGAPLVRTVLAYQDLVGYIVFLTSLVLMVTVMLFNVPKLVVPPSLRHQAGLLTRSSIRKALSRWRRRPDDRP